MPCIIKDLIHLTVFYDLSCVHNSHAVRHIGNYAQVMGNVDNRHVQLFLQIADQI